MNKVFMMGRLTRDPETRYTNQNQMAISRFSLAVDRRGKRGDETADFFNVTAFGKQAEFVEKYLKKGTKIVVVGRLQNDNYVGKDGTKVYGVQILADELEFAESKNTTAEARTPQKAAQSADDGFMHIPDDIDDGELPFN